MTESPLNAVIRFESNGFDMTGPVLMGRQAAGYGFLRAALAAEREGPLHGYGPNPQAGEALAALAARLDPAAQTAWISIDQVERFNAFGVCYRPDAALAMEARLRLRAGVARHCLCGVTHTLSSGRMMEAIAELVTAPLMPWDAVICTSQAARGVMETILDEQEAYTTWRFQAPAPERPQLPIIPLGIHTRDFDHTADDRARARAALELDETSVVVLYAGRLTFSDKAHPFAMLAAMQAAATQTGKTVILVLAGRFANDFGGRAYRAAVQTFCPDVRCIFVDGARFDAYRDAWSAADLFVSAADSFQETFGLTPLEAMAAGLPCVVSDWNGYRDTVRDGIDGFRVPTWAPAEGSGEALGRRLEAETLGDDFFAWRYTAAVAVDLKALTERLAQLIDNPDLRRAMGAAGRERARGEFEWTDVYRRYQALWGELNARRLAVAEDAGLVARAAAAPRASAGKLDPFRTFGHYPTRSVTVETVVAASPDASMARYRQLTTHPIFNGVFETPAHGLALMEALPSGDTNVGALARAARLPPAAAIVGVATLAKLGLVRLG